MHEGIKATCDSRNPWNKSKIIFNNIQYMLYQKRYIIVSSFIKKMFSFITNADKLTELLR